MTLDSEGGENATPRRDGNVCKLRFDERDERIMELNFLNFRLPYQKKDFWPYFLWEIWVSAAENPHEVAGDHSSTQKGRLGWDVLPKGKL